MKPQRRKIVFDFETRSVSNLKREGAFKYGLDPSTQPTCLAFKIAGAPKVYFLDFKLVNTHWSALPSSLKSLWQGFINEGALFVAHNAGFETAIYKLILVGRYGWPDIPFNSFRCTAAKAAACGLPRSLEGAGEALNLNVQKDKRGYVAMMATCKPTAKYRAWEKAKAEIASGKKVGAKKQAIAQAPAPKMFLDYDDNPQVWEVLYQYCKTDILTEEALDNALPDLIPVEQRVWFLNQQINWRGFKCDLHTIKKILDIISKTTKTKLGELDALTMGLVTKPGARASILEFLALDGIELPDIRANTIVAVLKNGVLNPDMQRLLTLRQELSKSSNKKYEAFVARASLDDRCRDILLYCGAHTGRDAGTGINPQNFPRGLMRVEKSSPYHNVQNVIDCDLPMLNMLYGDNLSILFSSLLRNMIIPSAGCELFAADFAKIEVAVLWWMAGNKPGLEILKAGKDPYIYQAASNMKCSYEEIDKEGGPRQLGKAQVLGAGFGCAWKKFRDLAADQYGLKLTNRESLEAIKSYREANEAVPIMWAALNNAAIYTIETGKPSKACMCKFTLSNGFLWVQLPSGRKLAYRKPRIVWSAFQYDALEIDPLTGEDIVVTREGKPRKSIEFLGLAKNKKDLTWERTHGAKLTENCFASATLILTNSGYKKIVDIKKDDLIFDGYNFVNHGGVICQGKKQVINWLGVKVTPDHLISDGSAWHAAGEMDAITLLGCLGWAQNLMTSPFCKAVFPDESPLSADANVELFSKRARAKFSKGILRDAENVNLSLYEKLVLGTRQLSRIKKCFRYGVIDTLEWFLGAITLNAKHFSTTAHGELEYLSLGLTTEKNFLNTQKPSRIGATSKRTWIELITVKGINPAISESFQDKQIPEIGAQLNTWFTKIKKFPLWYFGKSTHQNGKAIMQSYGTLGAENPPSTSSNITEKQEKVYDILNCGPRHQFVVLTQAGPVIAHNCVQAAARDLMAFACLRLEDNDYQVILTVHDEVISEKEKGLGSLDEYLKIMSERPDWADENLPIGASGWVGERYRK